MTVLDIDGQGPNVWVAGWWGVAELSDAGRVMFHASYAGAGWSLAVAGEAVWISLPWTGTPFQRRQDRQHRTSEVLRLATGVGRARPEVIDVPETGGTAAAGGTVWVGGGDLLGRIDESVSPPSLVPTDLTLQPTMMEAFSGGVWVAELSKRRVTEIVCS